MSDKISPTQIHEHLLVLVFLSPGVSQGASGFGILPGGKIVHIGPNWPPIAAQATAIGALRDAAEKSEDKQLGRHLQATADELAKVVYNEVQRSVAGSS
jgi:hypothetical protein